MFHFDISPFATSLVKIFVINKRKTAGEGIEPSSAFRQLLASETSERHQRSQPGKIYTVYYIMVANQILTNPGTKKQKIHSPTSRANCQTVLPDQACPNIFRQSTNPVVIRGNTRDRRRQLSTWAMLRNVQQTMESQARR